MASYVILLNWTDQGIKSVKDSTSRADAAQELMGSLGIKLTQIYWTLGQYDVVSIAEAPDDESMTAALLKLGSMGNIRSTTLRAFDRSEFEGILAKSG
jgi:uncharacterized protein with GYD domain